MSRATGYAALDAQTPLALFHFDRRALRADDVSVQITHCGVCHSDLHQVRNDWKRAAYPMVPGHEIVGRVSAVGASVSKFKPGDVVAVGTLVDSCHACEPCKAGQEQYCAKGVQTYNSKDPHGEAMTYGGYSDHIVVREDFVLRVPEGLDAARVAPLLCAGITTYSPLRHWKVGAGSRVGVAGLGGLGHMGLKLAVGLGADVTVITTSPSKEKDALALGAHRVLLSTDKAAMRAAGGGFDFILDTIPVGHEIAPYLQLLAPDGALVLVGVVDMLPAIHSGLLMGGRKSLAGSATGGIAETQELLDFCAQKNILPECEMIPIQQINHAFERMERADVKYRFVIDMASLASVGG